MHIIIPMSGKGQRFVDAGYTLPKPLIEIDGKPVIEHVVNLFPGETHFTFICNEEHLEQTTMRSVLERVAPGGNIVGIAQHKLGPVYAVSQVYDLIDDDEEVIVNYCDFSSWWDYEKTLKKMRKADGAVVCYRDFHPHMLGKTQYAFVRNEGKWLQEIREKEPFTNNRMQEYASNGTYYFRKGEYVKRFFSQLMERKIHKGGEYYVSLTFNLMVEAGLQVRVTEIEHMLQWGTPEDVEEYRYWSELFHRRKEQKRVELEDTILLMPMAGRGKRFVEAGITTPKPFICVDGKPLYQAAIDCLPKTKEVYLAPLLEHMEGREVNPAYHIFPLSELSQGQAETCQWAAEVLPRDAGLLIASCDNGVISDQSVLKEMVEDESVDAVIWTFRGHPAPLRHPEMYGWVQVEGDVTAVSVKKPLSKQPARDHAIVGTFWFRSVGLFLDCVQELRKRNLRVNGEFYVDSLIQVLLDRKKRVKAFEVDKYICWGTADEYKTYLYWQDFFSKCWWHEYKKHSEVYV